MQAYIYFAIKVYLLKKCVVISVELEEKLTLI